MRTNKPNAVVTAITSRYSKSLKPKSIQARVPISQGEKAAWVEYPKDAVRPTFRAQCMRGPRPCPWVSCRWHLYLDVSRNGSIKFNFPHLEPWELKHSCALDFCSQRDDGQSFDEIGSALGLTRARAQQLAEIAMARLEITLSKKIKES